MSVAYSGLTYLPKLLMIAVAIYALVSLERLASTVKEVPLLLSMIFGQHKRLTEPEERLNETQKWSSSQGHPNRAPGRQRPGRQRETQTETREALDSVFQTDYRSLVFDPPLSYYSEDNLHEIHTRRTRQVCSKNELKLGMANRRRLHRTNSRRGDRRCERALTRFSVVHPRLGYVRKTALRSRQRSRPPGEERSKSGYFLRA
jgi:hypothetical protein